jgi:hypothetical protein
VWKEGALCVSQRQRERERARARRQHSTQLAEVISSHGVCNMIFSATASGRHTVDTRIQYVRVCRAVCSCTASTSEVPPSCAQPLSGATPQPADLTIRPDGASAESLAGVAAGAAGLHQGCPTDTSTSGHDTNSARVATHPVLQSRYEFRVESRSASASSHNLYLCRAKWCADG